MKPILKAYLRLRWGVRGALKPPLAPRHVSPSGARIAWYRWRLFCWDVESRAYNWTGLPEDWWKAVGSECVFKKEFPPRW